MAFPRLGGAGQPLSLAAGLVPNFAGAPPVAAGLTNAVTLSGGETFTLPPGTFMVAPGSVTSLQFLDPGSGQWRVINADASMQPIVLDSDGTNFRLANLTGTPIGALITNSGAGYTNGVGTAATGLTITPSAGGSTWVPVVGGAINSTVTITAGGTGYLFAPILLIDAPPLGGIQATAVCTLSAGAINAVTVTNQGAGYRSAPTITVVNDPRDTAGSGGILTVNATLVNSGGLTAMYPSAQGTVLTALPTFTFSPASTTAATALMCWTVTTYAVTVAGVAAGTGALGIAMVGAEPFTNNRAANTAGPISDVALTQPRPAYIQGNVSGGALTAPTIGTNALILDPGFGFQAVPVITWIPQSLPTTWPAATATVGGTTDTSWIMRI